MTASAARVRPIDQSLLGRAVARVQTLDYYDRPLDAARVRAVVVPQLFALPYFSRFAAYAFMRRIAFRDEPRGQPGEDLVVHELTHIWQWQRRPVASVLALLRYDYRANPFEREARRAVADSRAT